MTRHNGRSGARSSSRSASRALAAVSALAALGGFFLPWVTVEVSKPGGLGAFGSTLGRVSVTVHRDGAEISGDVSGLVQSPMTLTGAQIPRMARESSTQAGVALLEMVTGRRYQAGLTSLLVFLVPAGALVCTVGIVGRVLTPAWSLAVAGLCGVAAAAGFWKVLTLPPPAVPIAVTIGSGLWISLWAYVGLALASFIDTLSRRGL